jgi:hypothetical protein
MGSFPFVPEARIEVGLTGPTVPADIWHIGDPVRGKIGTAKIGSDDIWVDVTEWVRSWSFRRGANRGNGIGLRYEAGTFTAELNNGDRRFDPTNLNGPYAPGGVTTLQPMVRVRLSAVWAGVAYQLWTGLADRWLPDYSQPTWSTTTLTATDAFKVFTGRKRIAVVPVGAGENSGARVSRVLTSIGWPVEDRDIATGKSVLQATALEGDGLAELQLVQDSEMGEFYMDARGEAVFRNRHATLTEARSNTAQAVFGDAGINAGEIPYAFTAVDNDDVTLANRVIAAIAGGTEQVAEDLASQARFLVQEYSKTDLLLTADSEALSWAQAVLSESKEPELRFAEVQFNVPTPDAADVTWPALLGRELGDRVTVIRRPPGGGDPNQRDCWVRGIEMSSDGANWKTTLPLETTTRQSFFTIGHPTLGRIGPNAIAF